MNWRSLAAFFASVIVIACVGNTLAQDKELRDAEDRVNKGVDVINEIMKADDKSIPRDLLAKAKAIVVFPGTVKGGFIIGAQGGKGLAISRLANGWSAPAFLNLGGGSVGFQAGASKTDYIMVITNDKGLASLLQDKFEIGGEGSVAAGPVGRTAAASTDAKMDAEILTYARSKGVFAGISLKGVAITPDKDMNFAVYKKTARDVLVDSPVAWKDAPKTLQRFPQTLATYAP